MKRLLLVAVAIGALAITSVALAAGLSGKYRATITSGKYNGQLNGAWTLAFTSGHYAVSFNGRSLIKGKVSFSGSTMKVGGAGKDAYCHNTGVYKFAVSGSSLTFKAVKDNSKGCGARRLVLTSGHFTKVS